MRGWVLGGQRAHHSNIIFTHRNVVELPQLFHHSDFFWGVHLYSEQDRPFMEAWRAKHGYEWPRISVRRVHPALVRPFYRYLNFESEWSGHAGNQAMGFYDFLMQEAIEDFRDPR